MGWVALLDTVFLICLPRIYLGIHYPTDMLAGALIGVGMGFLANQPAIKSPLAKWAFKWQKKSPGSFYAFSFLFMYQITVSFYEARYVVITSVKTFLKLIHH
jgi:undecaprenyl-diphosphatase